MTGLRSEIGRFGRYGIVGLVTNACLYLVFLVLLYSGVPAIAASAICYGAGVAASYLLNRRWAFKSQNGHGQDFPKFLLAYGIGLGVTIASIALLIRWMPAELAQLLTVGLTAFAIYTNLRLLRFGQREIKSVHESVR